MKFIYSVALMLFTGCCTGRVFPTTDDIQKLQYSESSERKLYGNIVPHGNYPWMVTLKKMYDDSTCVGAILSNYWILMSAHCIAPVEQYWTWEILVGMRSPSNKEDTPFQRVKVAGVATPPKHWKDGRNAVDVALLYTEEPINIKGSNGTVGMISLPEYIVDPTGYSKTIGWAPTGENGEKHLTLIEITIPLYPRDLCNYETNNVVKEGNLVTSEMLCGGMIGEYACQYASGSPIFQTKNGFTTLIGLISWDSGCGEKYFPGGAYTKISTYSAWIKTTMETTTMGHL